MSNKNTSVGLDLLTELIGHDKAALFVEHFGGIEYAVPKTHEKQQVVFLKMLLGEDEANILLKHFAGDVFYVKKGTQSREIRNKKFLNEYYSWMSMGAKKTKALENACLKYGISMRWGRKLIYRNEHLEQN